MIKVPYIRIDKSMDMQGISGCLDAESKYELPHILWTEPKHRPAVQFAIAHDGENIFLKYYVREKYSRAVETAVNGRVWEDSCVECFISFDKGLSYYNLEFNQAGTALVAFGKDRSNRQFLSDRVISSITRQPENGKNDGWNNWTLALRIPTTVFVHHAIETFSGLKARANFCKCGDRLPEPHFMAWHKPESATPDFHLPDYFGELEFMI